MQSSNTKTYRSGFTIVEMLLVVILIVLLASVGGGFSMGTYKRLLCEKSTRKLLLAAEYARVTAIERQRPCKIKLDTVNNRFWLVINELNEQSGETEEVMMRDLYSKPVEFGGDVKFEAIQIDSPDSQQQFETAKVRTIAFSPTGGSQSAVIQIGDGKNHLTLRILAATGKAKSYVGTAEDIKIGTIDLDEQ